MSFVPACPAVALGFCVRDRGGWTLSALGQLNRTGYGIACAAFIIFVWVGRSGWLTARIEDRGLRMDGHLPSSIFHLRFRAFARRFRRPLPLCFAALAVLIFLGGVLYPPSNYTGLNYREARILQWLAHDHGSGCIRPTTGMNDRACGFEWLTRAAAALREVRPRRISG